MKRVTFVGDGDIEVTLEVDFSDAAEGEVGNVRVQVEGIDVDTTGIGDTDKAAKVYGWYTPEEAREIAKYLNEMADKAESGRA